MFCVQVFGITVVYLLQCEMIFPDTIYKTVILLILTLSLFLYEIDKNT